MHRLDFATWNGLRLLSPKGLKFKESIFSDRLVSWVSHIQQLRK